MGSCRDVQEALQDKFINLLYLLLLPSKQLLNSYSFFPSARIATASPHIFHTDIGYSNRYLSICSGASIARAFRDYP